MKDYAKEFNARQTKAPLSGWIWELAGGQEYLLSSTIIVTKPVAIVTKGLLATLLVQGEGAGITVQCDGFSARGIIFQGTGGATIYEPGRYLLRAQGTYSTVRMKGLSLQDCVFKDIGKIGLYAQFVDDIHLQSIKFENAAYAGAMFLSCNKGYASDINIDVLNAVGNSDSNPNAYGFSLSHDLTKYDCDPHAGTLQAANPFCSDWFISGVSIRGPKIWQAFDCHGVYGLKLSNINVYACKFGISITTSSNDAKNYAGHDNALANFMATTYDINGCDLGVSGGYGLTLQGPEELGAKQETRNECLTVSNGTLRGFGAMGNAAASSLRVSLNTNLLAMNNIAIQDWQGSAVYIDGTSTAWSATGLIFGDMRQKSVRDGGPETEGSCFYIGGTAAGRGAIAGCIHASVKGNRAQYGIQCNSSFAGVVHGRSTNDFDSCFIAFNCTAAQVG